MRPILALLALAQLAGCAATECADGADIACLQAVASEEDLQRAIELAGPCYAAGAALCARADYCGALEVDGDACVEWWISTVCLDFAFDPDQMDHCAEWANDLECPYFEQGAAFYNGNPQPCEEEYPHPLGSGTW